jgi:anaerobic ribonucleoside-triphosphate reductase
MEDSAMAKFRCRTCGKEGTFVYDPERYTCPNCDSIDVQFAIGIEELDDDDPLIEAMKQRAEEDGEKNGH